MIILADASPFGRAPLLRTHFSPVFSIKMQKLLVKKFRQAFLFHRVFFFLVFVFPPCFSSLPVFLDIPKPKLCPNGDASGIILSGPDGSRHSSDQHPNSRKFRKFELLSNFCPGMFVLPKANSRGKWNFCVFTVFDLLSNTYRETPEPPGDGNSDFFLSFLSFVALSCSGLV